MTKKIRVGALISGGGTNLQAIIDASRSGAIDATLTFVGSDNVQAKGLERAASRGIPTFVVDYRRVLRTCRETRRGPAAGFRLPGVRAKQALIPGGATPPDATPT